MTNNQKKIVTTIVVYLINIFSLFISRLLVKVSTTYFAVVLYLPHLPLTSFHLWFYKSSNPVSSHFCFGPPRGLFLPNFLLNTCFITLSSALQTCPSCRKLLLLETAHRHWDVQFNNFNCISNVICAWRFVSYCLHPCSENYTNQLEHWIVGISKPVRAIGPNRKQRVRLTGNGCAWIIL